MTSKSKVIIEPAEEYRTRFMYCSIGATLMCLGVIVLVSGLVVYIISATGPNTYVNNMLFHHQHEYNNSYWPIIIAIILSSSGIAFITIAIVFTLLACFSHGRIEEQFNNRNSMARNHRSSPLPAATGGKAQSYEEERLISSPTLNELNPSESLMTNKKLCSSNQHNHHPYSQVQQQQPQLHHHYVPISKIENKQQTSTLVEISNNKNTNNNNDNNKDNHSNNNTNKGDINTVGLPLASTKKVPPNGFSYLSHPEEIQIYHEYHHHRTSSRNPLPPPTRATVRTTSRESVI